MSENVESLADQLASHEAFVLDVKAEVRGGDCEKGWHVAARGGYFLVRQQRHHIFREDRYFLIS